MYLLITRMIDFCNMYLTVVHVCWLVRNAQHAKGSRTQFPKIVPKDSCDTPKNT